MDPRRVEIGPTLVPNPEKLWFQPLHQSPPRRTGSFATATSAVLFDGQWANRDSAPLTLSKRPLKKHASKPPREVSSHSSLPASSFGSSSSKFGTGDESSFAMNSSSTKIEVTPPQLTYVGKSNCVGERLHIRLNMTFPHLPCASSPHVCEKVSDVEC